MPSIEDDDIKLQLATREQDKWRTGDPEEIIREMRYVPTPEALILFGLFRTQLFGDAGDGTPPPLCVVHYSAVLQGIFRNAQPPIPQLPPSRSNGAAPAPTLEETFSNDWNLQE